MMFMKIFMKIRGLFDFSDYHKHSWFYDPVDKKNDW